MTVVVDYGMGNLRSVARALEVAGGEPITVTDDANIVREAERVVVPGVGAFGDAMVELKRRGLDDAIRDVARRGVPLLGICLGLQVLFDEGEEFGVHAGLGLLPGRVVRFTDPMLKVPHLGWNRVSRTPAHAAHPVLGAVDDSAYFYFVHSYVARPAHADDIATTTDYGAPFTSAVARKNLLAVQFHPEKSQSVGLALLAAFARWRP